MCTSFCFLFCVVNVSLFSPYPFIELITTCLHDAFPKYIEKKRALIAIVTCAFMFLLGLPCVTQVRLLKHFTTFTVVLHFEL